MTEPTAHELIPDGGSGAYTDEHALDIIATILGSCEDWDSGMLESIAVTVGLTGRAHPGDQSAAVLRMYRQAADVLGIEHDGETPDDGWATCCGCGDTARYLATDGTCDGCNEDGTAAALDRASSVSRQHYIDTGRYLRSAEVAAAIAHGELTP